jgi:C4-dicarboxylate-binding protein DctP
MIAHGPLVFVSHRAIRTLADMKGQKIRVIAGTPLFIETAKKLGLSPIAMPLGEVLPALQNKALDGAVTGLTVVTSMKYFDVVKPATLVPGGIVIVGALTNSRWLKSLGAELDAIVRDEAAKANLGTRKFGVDDAAGASDVWRKNGGEVIELPAAEVAKYQEAVASALPPLLSANPQLKADYDVMLAISKRLAN